MYGEDIYPAAAFPVRKRRIMVKLGKQMKIGGLDSCGGRNSADFRNLPRILHRIAYRVELDLCRTHPGALH